MLNGVKYKLSLVLFGNFLCKYLIGEGIFSNNKWCKFVCIVCVCFVLVLNNFMFMVVCLLIIVGYVFMLKCCFFCL